MFSGTLLVFTKYEVVIRERQLFVGELIALSPQSREMIGQEGEDGS